MSNEPRARIRRRNIVVHAEDGQQIGTTIQQDVQEAFRLANIASDAKKAASDAMEELEKRMLKENRASVVVPMRGQVPAILADFKQSSSSKIDVHKFAKLVTKDQFYDCVTVSVTDAKKIVSENALKAVTTTTKGKKSLNVRIMPKNYVAK